MHPLVIAAALILIVVVVLVVVMGRTGSSKPPVRPATPAPSPATGVKVGGKVDLPAELISRVRELELAHPEESGGDAAAGRALFEEAMALAESSGGRRAALDQALTKLEASRRAKHTSGLCEIGFSEVLRQAALSDPDNPHQAALEKSLEYAQKATAQNSLENEAWVAYAHALVASGSVADGEAVMADHGSYDGYRMHRARAAAAIARQDLAAAAAHLERAIAGCREPDARAALEQTLAGVYGPRS